MSDDHLWSLFERFVAADTAVRPGERAIVPHDDRLASFAHEVAAPALASLGADVRIDALNNVVAQWGELSGRELLFVSYPAVHHGNEMDEPLRARRRGDLWVGLGASQGKAGLAAACEAMRTIDPAGRAIVAVCSEASSSHRSSAALFAGFEQLPAGAVLTMGTENRISLGNRGRVDAVVTIEGRATHSSAPDRGVNPIPLVAEVLALLAGLELGDAEDERLGRRTLVPYALECGPVAPHTIPQWCRLVLDRRLLPGDDPDDAVAQIRAALTGIARIEKGAWMLPALVEESAEIVVALQEGARALLGRPLETYYRRDTFDAGWACSLGVPTVMCGPSTADFGGDAVLGEDAVAAERVREAAAIFAGAVASRR